jgi:hypothetical protein
MLRVHRKRLERCRRIRDGLLPEEVATSRHRGVVPAEPPRDDHVLDQRRLAQGLVHRLLDRQLLAATQGSVRTDDHLRPGVDEALGEGRGGEAGEDRHVHRAHMGASVRGDRHLRAHREKQRDAVARADAEGDEPFREPRDLDRELREGQLVAGAVLPARDRSDLACEGAAGKPVYAVPGDVQGGPAEPGRPLRAARVVVDPPPRSRELEAHVLDRGGPEPSRVLLRAPNQLAVVGDAVPAHKPGHVRALDGLPGRTPDDLSHRWMLT